MFRQPAQVRGQDWPGAKAAPQKEQCEFLIVTIVRLDQNRDPDLATRYGMPLPRPGTSRSRTTPSGNASPYTARATAIVDRLRWPAS